MVLLYFKIVLVLILDFKLKETPGDGSQGRDGSAVTSSLNQSDYF
jgi:hypothetical protein